MTLWNNIFTFKLDKFPNLEMLFPAVSMDIKSLQTGLKQNLKRKTRKGLLNYLSVKFTFVRPVELQWHQLWVTRTTNIQCCQTQIIITTAWQDRINTAALDLCLVPFRFDFASPFINLAWFEARSWDCLTDELLPVGNLQSNMTIFFPHIATIL